MVATLYVAVVAYVIRALTRSASLVGSFVVWVPLTIVLALFLFWPIGRAIASAFEPREVTIDSACPKCGRREFRPLVREGAELFQPVASYRCAVCLTTLRRVGSSYVEERAPARNGPPDSSGIEFLDREASEGEIHFLEDGSA
jgi:hypothetical protein